MVSSLAELCRVIIGGNSDADAVRGLRAGDAETFARIVENITPILGLHQAESWQPDTSSPGGMALRTWLYASTLLGWAGTTLLIAAFSGLARSDGHAP